MPERGADRAPGGVDAGDQQQHDRADDVLRLELLAIQLGVDQVGREVITRVIDVLADLVVEVVEEWTQALAALFRRQVDGAEHVLDELREQGRVLLGKPEHVADHPHRDVLRVVLGGVDHALPVRGAERVDQRVAVRPGGLLVPADGRLGEGRQQELARVVVERRVGGDRRRAADRGEVERRPEVADDDRPRGEALGVVGDRGNVFVARRQPGAAEPLGVRDRAALPQVVLDRERVRGPLGVRVREVARPVGDGAGDHLAEGSRLLLVALPRGAPG